MTDKKEQFLSKLLGPDEDISWFENVAIEAVAFRSLVEIRVIPPKPCDYAPVEESELYKLDTELCDDEDNARTVFNQGLADLKAGIKLKAADYNNLACAVMWMKPQSNAKSLSYVLDWFKKANDIGTPGYDLLSDSSISVIKKNFTLAQKPPKKPDLPLLRKLSRQAFDQLAKTIGLMGKEIEGFSIRLEEDENK